MSQNTSTTSSTGSFEQFILSTPFAALTCIFGTTIGIIFAFRENFYLALLSAVVFGSACVTSLVLRIYRKKIQDHYSNQTKELTSELQRSCDAIECLHRYVHVARDHACELMRRWETLTLEAEDDNDLGSDRYHREVTHLKADLIRPLLEEMIRIFNHLVPPGAQLWAAIREIRHHDDDNRNYYHTLLRAGVVNHDRKATSQPIPEDAGLSRKLRQQHRELGDGILLLRENRSDDDWQKTPNDERREDKSVLAGPVFQKSAEPPEMLMILFLNSPASDVFSEWHKPYMKCCTDVLSMFFSVTTPFIVDFRENN